MERVINSNHILSQVKHLNSTSFAKKENENIYGNQIIIIILLLCVLFEECVWSEIKFLITWVEKQSQRINSNYAFGGTDEWFVEYENDVKSCAFTVTRFQTSWRSLGDSPIEGTSFGRMVFVFPVKFLRLVGSTPMAAILCWFFL